MTGLADRLARIRLSAGAIVALALAGCLIALVALAVAVASFQRQTEVSQREAQAAINEAIAKGEANRQVTCAFVRAFVPAPGQTGAQTPSGKRVEIAARKLADAAHCP